MILSAGLTPAWQQILLFDSFRYGEVNRAAEVHWHAQGKVLNAGIAAHHFGGPTVTLAPLGGQPMERIDHEFDELGIPHRWITTQSSTRICTTILDRATGVMTELVENGKSLLPSERDAFRDAYAEEAAKADVVILAGSLPTGEPPSYYRELVERTPCPMVLDFRGEGLLGCLDLKPLVVKPNREELGHTVGRVIENDSQLVETMRSLNHRGAGWVVISQGTGPVWVTSMSKTYRLGLLHVEKVVNPIGSGDTMAAGIASGIEAGLEVIEAVRLGIAAAKQNVLRLDTGRINPVLARKEAESMPVEEMSNLS